MNNILICVTLSVTAEIISNGLRVNYSNFANGAFAMRADSVIFVRGQSTNSYIQRIIVARIDSSVEVGLLASFGSRELCVHSVV